MLWFSWNAVAGGCGQGPDDGNWQFARRQHARPVQHLHDGTPSPVERAADVAYAVGYVSLLREDEVDLHISRNQYRRRPLGVFWSISSFAAATTKALSFLLICAPNSFHFVANCLRTEGLLDFGTKVLMVFPT